MPNLNTLSRVFMGTITKTNDEFEIKTLITAALNSREL
jgi:hypothetical protein